MAIEYSLVGNPLTEADNYRARVRLFRTATMDDVVSRIVEQGSTITRADILAVLDGYEKAIEHLLLEGCRVNTPLVNFGLGLKGVFEYQQDAFDPTRHQLVGSVSVGSRLRQAISIQGRVVRTEPGLPAPRPLEYHDVATGGRNGVVTPGALGQVAGHRLKFDPADEAQGAFFVSADGAETRVAMLSHIRPRELTFLVPAGLAPGSYWLEVRAAFGEELRSGALEKILTV